MIYFEDLIKSMNNWEEEIFNYFNSPITNAYTESLNRLIKTKILFIQGYHKVKKKFKERKMLPDQFPDWSQTGYEWVYEEIYGADFSTLTKLWKWVLFNPLSKLFSDYPYFISFTNIQHGGRSISFE